MSNIVYEQNFKPNPWLMLALAVGGILPLVYEIWRGYKGLTWTGWVVVPGLLLGTLFGIYQNRSLVYRLYQDRVVLSKRGKEIVIPIEDTVSMELKLTIAPQLREKGSYIPMLPFGLNRRFLHFKKEGHDAAVLIFPDNRLLELLERWVGKNRTKHRMKKG